MRNRSIILVFALVFSMTAPSAQSHFESGGIRSGLERSPGDYVAAVIELRGTITCDEAKTGRLCWSYAFVIDEIASRPASKSPRIVIKIAAGRKTGEQVAGRAIAFLVPRAGTDVYSGTFMTVYTRAGHERFRRAVETTIGGTRSL